LDKNRAPGPAASRKFSVTLFARRGHLWPRLIARTVPVCER